jgi:hypothetical protein
MEHLLVRDWEHEEELARLGDLEPLGHHPLGHEVGDHAEIEPDLIEPLAGEDIPEALRGTPLGTALAELQASAKRLRDELEATEAAIEGIRKLRPS